jgi:hypothetical protein
MPVSAAIRIILSPFAPFFLFTALLRQWGSAWPLWGFFLGDCDNNPL